MEIAYQDIFKEREEDVIMSGEGIENIVCRNLYKFIFDMPEDDVPNKQIQD